MKKLRVGILFGGRSGEHEVSLLSAASVFNAIDKNKYEVVPIGITKAGHWVTAADAKRLLAGEGARPPPAPPRAGGPAGAATGRLSHRLPDRGGTARLGPARVRSRHQRRYHFPRAAWHLRRG